MDSHFDSVFAGGGVTPSMEKELHHVDQVCWAEGGTLADIILCSRNTGIWVLFVLSWSLGEIFPF